MDKLFSHSEQPLDAAITHAAHVVRSRRSPCLACCPSLIQTAHMEAHRLRVQRREVRQGRILGTSLAAQVIQLGWRSELSSDCTASSHQNRTAKPSDGSISKVLQCSIQRNDLESASKILDEMPENVKRAPLTQFLTYKLALRNGDEAIGSPFLLAIRTSSNTYSTASECLASIAQTSSTQTDLLYACVAESQQSSNKSQAIAALRSVMISCDHNVANGAHFPALLR